MADFDGGDEVGGAGGEVGGFDADVTADLELGGAFDALDNAGSAADNVEADAVVEAGGATGLGKGAALDAGPGLGAEVGPAASAGGELGVETGHVTPAASELAKGPDAPEAVQGAEFEEVGREIDAYEALLDGVNPNFDPFDQGSLYSNNCGSCALATELRLSGLDPEAVAVPQDGMSVDEMNAATGMEQVSMTPDQIEAYALEQGPGYHAICGFDWSGSNDGHWVNITVSETGRVYVLDGQVGRAMLLSEYTETYAKASEHWDLSLPREDGKGQS